MSQDNAGRPGYDTAGRLIYAIGDIHGRDDLAAAMIDRIVADADQQRNAFQTRPLIVFLGDYIDRGRQSRAVIDRVLSFRSHPDFEVRFLLGNHEESFLAVLDGETSALHFICHTHLVERFREIYPDSLTFAGNRSILLKRGAATNDEALAHCIKMALGYYLRT